MQTTLTYVPYSMFTVNNVIVTLERAESKAAYYWRARLAYPDGYTCSFGKGGTGNGKGGPGGKETVKRKAIECAQNFRPER